MGNITDSVKGNFSKGGVVGTIGSGLETFGQGMQEAFSKPSNLAPAPKVSDEKFKAYQNTTKMLDQLKQEQEQGQGQQQPVSQPASQPATPAPPVATGNGTVAPQPAAGAVGGQAETVKNNNFK